VSDTDGKINWFEIPATDAARARGFYAELFGWQFQAFEEGGDYQMTDSGAVYTAPDKDGLTVYFSTSDIDAAVVRIRELGGEAAEPQPIPNVGRYAVCGDTEGNTFGLFQGGA
jgi:predicted enzyme related to lactoylglutathione lyase